MDEETHEMHHRWVETEMRKSEWRAKFWEKMAIHAAKWGVVSVLSALGYALYLGFQQWLSKHP